MPLFKHLSIKSTVTWEARSNEHRLKRVKGNFRHWRTGDCEASSVSGGTRTSRDECEWPAVTGRQSCGRCSWLLWLAGTAWVSCPLNHFSSCSLPPLLGDWPRQKHSEVCPGWDSSPGPQRKLSKRKVQEVKLTLYCDYSTLLLLPLPKVQCVKNNQWMKTLLFPIDLLCFQQAT